MRRLLQFIICLTALLACSNQMGNLPNDIIQPNEFGEIVLDIRLAEAHQKVLRQKGRYNADLVDSSYQVIYALHDVTENEMVRSYQFYINHPQWLEKLSSDVIEQLNKMEE